jgi:hypothetical protein
MICVLCLGRIEYYFTRMQGIYALVPHLFFMRKANYIASLNFFSVGFIDALAAIVICQIQFLNVVFSQNTGQWTSPESQYSECNSSPPEPFKING